MPIRGLWAIVRPVQAILERLRPTGRGADPERQWPLDRLLRDDPPPMVETPHGLARPYSRGELWAVRRVGCYHPGRLEATRLFHNRIGGPWTH